VAFDEHFRETLERITAGLRAELEREFTPLTDELKRAAAEERERVTRAAAEIEALKSALAHERERAAQEAAENAASDMRRQAEVQAQIAQLHDNARRRIEEIQRAAAEERERAVKEAAQQAAEAAAEDVRRQSDAQIGKIRDTAHKHAEGIKRAAEAQVNELRETLRAQLEQVRRAAQAQADDTRRDLEAQIEEVRRQARVAEEKAKADLERTNADLERTNADLERTKADLEKSRTEAEAALRAASAETEEVRSRAHTEAQKAQAALETVRAEAEATTRAVRTEAEEVLIAQLAAADAEAAQKIEQAIDRTRTDAHQADLAHTARLVDAVRRLDDARSLGDALDALADCAARHVDRAGVLVVKGDGLRIRRLAGFGGDHPPADLDLDAAGLAGAVVSTGITVSRAAVEPGEAQGSRQPALPSFARTAGARHAVALPITVGGRVVAVLYADAPPPDAPSAASRWPSTLEVLARHASRALEAMTVEQATGLSLPRRAARPTRGVLPGPVEHGGTGDEDAARRYARLLVSEIRMYHEPLVDAGRRSHDLRSRLGGEIDRARRLYEERVPQAVRDRSDFFEQELVRTLADGDRSLLG
jgi:hypothetical protein